ncbi:hypothetical protein BDV33DRAFT_185002 [Aspergillus novoparasiticus]|uniref:GRF-like zinc ribbon domain-containing protein n=1 Tax=Aspergillus novoparasiticus TaxID=986946 RepID=A0A5N6E6W7_9EURO|nr:hypothetical protein BDV33DRAFT_185002 [Aspergillus novoparasiticus]
MGLRRIIKPLLGRLRGRHDRSPTAMSPSNVSIQALDSYEYLASPAQYNPYRGTSHYLTMTSHGHKFATPKRDDLLPHSSIETRLCKKCRNPTVLTSVKPWNERNAGRLYLKCSHCGLFHSWADKEGIHDQNPICRCGHRSRLSSAGPHKRSVQYFECASGYCGFYVEPYNWKIPVPYPEMEDTCQRKVI